MALQNRTITFKKRSAFIKLVDHPEFGTGQFKLHHVIYWENFGKRPDWKNKREVIHHKNGNWLDNRQENLELITQTEHIRHHNPRKGISHTEETKQKMSKSKIGNKIRSGILHEKAALIKISKGAKSWWESEAGKNRKELMKNRISK